ncbi:MAG: NAD(P)-dependent alcohol dehydrogenase [Gammaproteobacteria bacterium]|nr:NAD(P)-dependent alcohol dehydrogenase [Gammaproteobacteria bacterium]MDH3410641.1 NAD(P)-dependent alcohol dehydrogenase [Gammaproteobacteria bacterium]
MRAIIWPKYGPPDVLQLKVVETPTPKGDEVLIKVVAATVFAGDCEMRRFDFPMSFWLPLRLMFGLRKPKRKVQILGQELAGEIEAVGKDVTQFKKGDQVFAPAEKFGAYADYICLPATDAIARKPANMSYEEAATVPVGGLNALHFVRKGNVQTGDEVLINGAAGSIGTFAVQIAKIAGAEVTAVDSSRKLDMLRSIGADEVIDYTQEDFTRNGKTYDVIIDVVGKSSYSRSVTSLNENGRYVLGNPRFSGLFKGLWTSLTSSKKVIAALTGYKAEDLVCLKDLIEAGKMKTVIDRRYPLEDIVEAHRYVETGQKTGHVVITVAGDGKSDPDG